MQVRAGSESVSEPGTASDPWTFDRLPDYAFPRLAGLLAGTEPGAVPIDLALGEPKHAFPPMVTEILAREAAGYGRYPPPAGTPDHLDAVTGWLNRRYGLSEGWIDPRTHVIALNGTREGLFMAAQTLAGHKADRSDRPAILMPNPFYQCYAAAAVSIGAEPVFLDATAATGHLPDLEALPEDLLARTAAVYLCSPANPQGTVADGAYWGRLLELAQAHDFFVFADECYAEIYDAGPPTGILETAHARGTPPARILAFHSLSKRSNLPGLRCGFVAGDPLLIARFRKLRSYGGAPSPLPIQAAAAAVWREDTHVEANRALYTRKLDWAAEHFADRFGFFRPPGGFFLWLDMSRVGLSGEQATLHLWRETGVRVLPGAYLARGHGRHGADNPGHDYIRVALVHDETVTQDALSRLIATVGG
ncbi:MAG: aminotransferase class I/II-fold pyridoxal phosphate-dependent enzyme [Alphaproteobacteria bacterium]